MKLSKTKIFTQRKPLDNDWVHKYRPLDLYGSSTTHYAMGNYRPLPWSEAKAKRGEYLRTKLSNIAIQKWKPRHYIRINTNNACFADVRNELHVYREIVGRDPRWIAYNINWNLTSRSLSRLQVKQYLTALKDEGLLGEGYSVKKMLTDQTGYILNPTQYSIDRLFFILCNYRAIREHPRYVHFINWCTESYGMMASCAMAVGVARRGFGSGHHYYDHTHLSVNNKREDITNRSHAILEAAWRYANFLDLYLYKQSCKYLLDKGKSIPYTYHCSDNIALTRVPETFNHTQNLFTFKPRGYKTDE